MKRVCDQNVQQDSADQMKNFLELLDKHEQAASNSSCGSNANRLHPKIASVGTGHQKVLVPIAGGDTNTSIGTIRP